MELPSAEVAALAMLLIVDVEVNPGDAFPCGSHDHGPTLGALRRYIVASPEMLAEARALADAWRRDP